MRAVEPGASGTTRLSGYDVAWESFGEPSNPTILFFPSWQIVHSRIWKMQVPFFSRDFHVLTFDSPGNGKSELTLDERAYEVDRIVDYGVGLLDLFNVERAHVVGLSLGAMYGLWMAARYPERVASGACIGTALTLLRVAKNDEFWDPAPSHPEGWEKYRAEHWRRDFEDWLRFFMGEIASEPHSTKQFDDLMSWGRGTNAEILVRTVAIPSLVPELSLEQVLERIRCPILMIHGTDDRIMPVSVSREISSLRPDFRYLEMESSGHTPNCREPVKVNRVIASFFDRPEPTPQIWQRPMARTSKRVLFVSSPIGLGHTPRDLAIASELRKLIPGIQIDWLATDPITRLLDDAGESVHPRSRELSNKTAHWESMCTDFDLHCFNAFREMDEILVHNFMVFLDAVSETQYDLWLGDEAWEVDHYLHESPELKTAPFVFMTDFVGYLPMDRRDGSREAILTADYNAEIIEHIERYPWVRDRSLYFGELDDVVPDQFGPGLPRIRDWMKKHFTPVGHVLTFDPSQYASRNQIRERLGYATDRPLVVVAIGGTAAGYPLLQKVIESWSEVLERLPDAQCLLVAGPRIDPTSLPRLPGLSIHSYVNNLFEHFAAADVAVVQGGLTTTMELTALGVPFIYFPLRNHFEQQFHVVHRLERHNAGIRMDFHQTDPGELASAIIDLFDSDTSGYRQVVPDGARRTAAEIASIFD